MQFALRSAPTTKISNSVESIVAAITLKKLLTVEFKQIKDIKLRKSSVFVFHLMPTPLEALSRLNGIP